MDFLCYLIIECGFSVDDEGGFPGITATEGTHLEALALLLAYGARTVMADDQLAELAVQAASKNPCLQTMKVVNLLYEHTDDHHACAAVGITIDWPDPLGPQPNFLMHLSGLGFAPYLRDSVLLSSLRSGRFKFDMKSAMKQCRRFEDELYSTSGANLVLLAARSWGRDNHHLFPRQERVRVPYLLWVGRQLVTSSSSIRIPSVDWWMDSVMPFLISPFLTQPKKKHQGYKKNSGLGTLAEAGTVSFPPGTWD
jgi:hypothetical protein